MCLDVDGRSSIVKRRGKKLATTQAETVCSGGGSGWECDGVWKKLSLQELKREKELETTSA